MTGSEAQRDSAPSNVEIGAGGVAGPRWLRLAGDTLAVLLTLISIVWALELFSVFGFAWYNEQILAVILGMGLALSYLSLPMRRHARRDSVPWYDIVAGVAGLAACLYIAVTYDRLVNLIVLGPAETVVLGLVLVPLVIEALRRAVGPTLPAIVILFILYALIGDMIPGQMAGRAQSVDVLAGYLAFDGSSILGRPLFVAGTIVIVFIFFGQLLAATRGSIFFTDLAQAAMGRYRGGPAKIAILGSGLFGSISGSAVANVVATGVVTIPMIKQSGYPAHKAGAIEAVASTGGQLMPPVMGAAAFLMAEFLGVSYDVVILAALLPGLLYYVALFFQADLEAARDGIAAIPRAQRPAWRIVGKGWFFALPFAVLLIGLFSFGRSPQEAVLWACAALLVGAFGLGYRGQRPRFFAALETVRKTGYAVLDIILVCAGAGIVIGVLGVTGLGFNFTNALVDLGENNLFLLLLVAAVTCILLGMGLPTVGVYVLLAALVAPALVRVGIEPIAAHLYVLYFGMLSMITPPVAIAAFFAASLAKAGPMKTGWTAVRFGWIAYVVPFLFVLAPALLMQGEAPIVFATFATGCFGIWLMSMGITGYFVRRLNAASRLFVGTAGAMALLPTAAFPGALYLDIAGIALGVFFVAFELMQVHVLRKRREA